MGRNNRTRTCRQPEPTEEEQSWLNPVDGARKSDSSDHADTVPTDIRDLDPLVFGQTEGTDLADDEAVEWGDGGDRSAAPLEGIAAGPTLWRQVRLQPVERRCVRHIGEHAAQGIVGVWQTVGAGPRPIDISSRRQHSLQMRSAYCTRWSATILGPTAHFSTGPTTKLRDAPWSIPDTSHFRCSRKRPDDLPFPFDYPEQCDAQPVIPIILVTSDTNRRGSVKLGSRIPRAHARRYSCARRHPPAATPPLTPPQVTKENDA